ncbi:hypothetical protein [Alicyclobacillus acidoterrestris]|uniref:Uncharacterized protein n=1 Tax=Alicyclobacillus acidoterrestris (strain ATCC 49025 / DSM 3922 / CIP 106132 / NCIMB 13137 / GD3B) TaxID=1356854 RepID=T0C5D0_ALIAG|nr:hypothetical protein [Alicyclobacillus acidoterrestris]EPZ47755.1 hypothetical protein N007_05735 [Alicyclobacillus acidoterrestris ATCC 49025]UNO47940.1 hypothetical protein K1I37_14795 [Alicyclobacillus acidoterrestris]
MEGQKIPYPIIRKMLKVCFEETRTFEAEDDSGLTVEEVKSWLNDHVDDTFDWLV